MCGSHEARRAPRLMAAFLAALLLFWAAPIQAALPAMELAQARQASLRGALKSGPTVDVSVTVLSDTVQTFGASKLRLGASKKLVLAAKNSAAKEGASHLEIKPPSLVIDANASLPWSVVFALLSAPDPLASLEATLGPIDPAERGIKTLGEVFVFRYGASPRVVLSRDLGQIRGVFTQVDGVGWEFRLSGELGAGGLPERVDILRDGAPFANIILGANKPRSGNK